MATRIAIIKKRETSTAVKYFARYAIPGFLALFVGFSFPQAKSKTQEAPAKTAAKAQPKTAQKEKTTPAAPGAIFPVVVARVNGTEIPGRDLEDLVRRELSTIGNPEWKSLRAEYRAELTLNNITALVNSKILYQQAIASGTQATDAEVQAEVQKVAKTFSSEAEMNAALASQNSDRATLEKSIRENLIMSKYVEGKVKVTVAEEDLSKYYEENREEFRHPDIVRTSHILIRAAGDTADQDAIARERAESLLSRVKKGEDFAKLARENSVDTSASQGGDIGYTSREALAPEYAEAAFSGAVGDLQLVKTQYGYHIIKVTDKKSEGLFTLAEIKPQLSEQLRNQKYQEELKKLVNQLREKANVEILISAGEVLKP